MELISRQAAIEALENDKAELSRIIRGMSANDAQLDHYVAQHNQVVYDIDAIKQLPPIQPEIVRCKDCKHRDPEDKKCDCGHDILWQLPRRNDWFCADGER